MFLFSNQLDYIFWRYPGTGSRNIQDYEWIKEINKDILNLILSNSGILVHLSVNLNLSINKLKRALLSIWNNFI